MFKVAFMFYRHMSIKHLDICNDINAFQKVKNTVDWMDEKFLGDTIGIS